MNPYRDNLVPISAAPRRVRKRLTAQRKTAGFFLVVAAIHAAVVAWMKEPELGPWPFVACVGLIVLGIVLVIAGRSRTPYTRLCSLLWNRGDRVGATMLFFNVIQPRYSEKRLARNRAALEAAQVGMPKHHGF